MQARYEDAAAGWAIYRSAGGVLGRDELNQQLEQSGHRPISTRTFGHYRKLLRLDYREYVSINRFDIKQGSASVFDESDRARYLDRPVAAEATLHIPQRDSVILIHGTVDRVSESYAAFVTSDIARAGAFSRATTYKSGVLRFETTGVERAVRVGEFDDLGDVAELILGFRRLLDTELVAPGQTAPTLRSRIDVDLGPEPSLALVLSVVKHSFDLYESSRGLVELTRRPGEPSQPMPRVASLHVTNPFKLELAGSPEVWAIAGSTLTAVSGIAFASLREAREWRAERRADDESRREAERHALSLEALNIKNLKDEVELRAMLSQLPETQRSEMESRLGSLDKHAQLQAQALQDDALRASVELTATSNNPVEISPVDVPDETS